MKQYNEFLESWLHSLRGNLDYSEMNINQRINLKANTFPYSKFKIKTHSTRRRVPTCRFDKLNLH